jgi:DtxR family Mn-dependent transcriptional regulator
MKSELVFLINWEFKEVLIVDKKISHTHDHELSHSMVHYLLTIHKLREIHGYARVTDIAKDLNLTKGSVSTAINNLKKKNLVKEDDNKFLFLSEHGHREVHIILTSKTLLYYFLKDAVGVTAETAHKDSCLMEHLLSDETRSKLFSFLKIISGVKAEGKNLFSTELDLNQFGTFNEFIESQKGDKHLD